MIYKLNISVPLMSRRVEFRFVPSKNVTPTSPLVAVVPIEWFGQMYVMWCDGGKWAANEILEFPTANLPCKVDKDPRLTAMLSIASQISRKKTTTLQSSVTPFCFQFQDLSRFIGLDGFIRNVNVSWTKSSLQPWERTNHPFTKEKDTQHLSHRH